MKKHGKKYNAAAEKIEVGRKYNLDEAVSKDGRADRLTAIGGDDDLSDGVIVSGLPSFSI